MFRLLRWGFTGLILLIGLGGLQYGYNRLAATGFMNLPFSPIPFLRPAPGEGEVAYSGVDQVRLTPGEFLPGASVSLVSLESGQAVFAFAQEGQRVLKPGDAVRYEGPWHEMPGTEFHYSGRVIRVSDQNVLVGGFYSLNVHGVDPLPGNTQVNNGDVYGVVLSAATEGEIAGTSLLYQGRAEGGEARIAGLETGTHPLFSVGDSLDWSGQLRSDLRVRYNLRVVFYTRDFIVLGGTVTLVQTA